MDRDTLRELRCKWIDSDIGCSTVGLFNRAAVEKQLREFWADNESLRKVVLEARPEPADEGLYKHFHGFGFSELYIGLPPGTVVEVVYGNPPVTMRRAAITGMVWGRGQRQDYGVGISFSDPLTCDDVESLLKLLKGSFSLNGETSEEFMREHIYKMVEYYPNFRGMVDSSLFCAPSKSLDAVMQKWTPQLKLVDVCMAGAYTDCDEFNHKEYLRALAAVGGLQGAGRELNTARSGTAAAASVDPLQTPRAAGQRDREQTGSAILDSRSGASMVERRSGARTIGQIAEDAVVSKRRALDHAHQMVQQGLVYVAARNPGGMREMYNGYASFLRFDTGEDFRKA